MAITYKKIASVTVGSGGTTTISFTSIPATYTDLLVKMSLRADTTADYISLRFNSSTSSFTSRYLLGDGSAASSGSRTDTFQSATVNLSTFTASTFSNAELYIPNYAGSTNKSFSIDTINENNATTAYMQLIAGLWSNTAAISSITMVSGAGASNFVQYSTATLYGILKA